MDPSESTIDPSVSTMDPSVSTTDPSVSTMDPSVSTTDPSVSAMDSSVSPMDLSVSTMDPSSEFSSLYPVAWQGTLQLQNDEVAVQMHYVSGNIRIARESLPPENDFLRMVPRIFPSYVRRIYHPPSMRVYLRIRAETHALRVLEGKMKISNEHCVLFAVPCGKDGLDLLRHFRTFKSEIINYFVPRADAWFVNDSHPGSNSVS
ncbi:protein split ends [Trichonephila inaurata madagascariensis]|uniref:Protein split ends n=1 Tax=Trichonephila inaurata madagascariensis TaxID=2747483 RepID=A0A8X6YV28_9ARAC|nr:protein split ends [Trichonephila inaurata madagascariensis]